MRKLFVKIVAAAVLAVSSGMAANAQKTVAMPFSAIPVNAADAAKAGIGFTENPFITGRTLDVSAGYMSYSPSYIPSSYLNLDAEYCLKGRLSFTLTGVYGMNPQQMLVGVGAGYRFLDFLSAKVNLKYLSDNPVTEVSYGAFGADIAVTGLFEISSASRIAAELGAYSLGTKITSASGMKFSLPSYARISGAYIHDIDQKNSFSILAQADYYLHNAFGAAIAAEADIADLISVRAGYNLGAENVLPSFASAGIGVHFIGIRIDAAYLFANEVIGNTLALSLGYSF